MGQDIEEVLNAIAKRRASKERAVFTNGCFDVLHVGHIRYLAEARGLGEFLVVGLNSDGSVQHLKGPERPVVSLPERQEILSALRSVDYVIPFDEETPLELIKRVKPDVLVKGGDWPEDKIVGAQFVKENGGTVRSLPYYPGHSTTGLISKIKKL